MVLALGFLVVQWHNYDFSRNYLGANQFNSDYWLHPENRHVAEVQYIKKYSGYVNGITILDNGNLDITLKAENGESFVHTLDNEKKNSFYLATVDSPRKLTMQEFFSDINRENQISYRCDLRNTCDYFRI